MPNNKPPELVSIYMWKRYIYIYNICGMYNSKRREYETMITLKTSYLPSFFLIIAGHENFYFNDFFIFYLFISNFDFFSLSKENDKNWTQQTCSVTSQILPMWSSVIYIYSHRALLCPCPRMSNHHFKMLTTEEIEWCAGKKKDTNCWLWKRFHKNSSLLI